MSCYLLKRKRLRSLLWFTLSLFDRGAPRRRTAVLSLHQDIQSRMGTLHASNFGGAGRLGFGGGTTMVSMRRAVRSLSPALAATRWRCCGRNFMNNLVCWLVTCRPSTSALVVVVENRYGPQARGPQTQANAPTLPVGLIYRRASPAFGQSNRPSGRVADRPFVDRRRVMPEIRHMLATAMAMMSLRAI